MSRQPVKADALVCRYCGREIQQGTAAAALTMPAAAVIVQPTKAPPSRAGKIALGVVLVFGALFVLMIVIGLLTSPGARDTTSPTAAGESAVEPATLVREPEAQQVQASLLVAANERNDGQPSTKGWSGCSCDRTAAPLPVHAKHDRRADARQTRPEVARDIVPVIAECPHGRSGVRLDGHVLGAIAEFERERVRERVRAGLARARAHGQTLGRPRATRLSSDAPAGLTVRQAAALWGVSKSTAARRLAEDSCPLGQTCLDTRQVSPCVSAGVLNVWGALDNEPIVPPIPDAPLTDGRAAV